MDINLVQDLIEARIKLKEEEEKQMEKLMRNNEQTNGVDQQTYNRIFGQNNPF